jgi:hypothetical protein
MPRSGPVRGGQADPELGAPTGSAVDVESPALGGDRLADDGQAEPPAGSLGGVSGLEDPPQLDRRAATVVIGSD